MKSVSAPHYASARRSGPPPSTAARACGIPFPRQECRTLTPRRFFTSPGSCQPNCEIQKLLAPPAPVSRATTTKRQRSPCKSSTYLIPRGPQYLRSSWIPDLLAQLLGLFKAVARKILNATLARMLLNASHGFADGGQATRTPDGCVWEV